MGIDTPDLAATEWLTLSEIEKLLDESPGRVRRLLDEQQLLASRRGGPLTLTAWFFLTRRPILSLRGTIIVLQDAGFTDDEAIDWLLAPEESIGMPPIEALRAGRKSEVRRVAAALA